MTALEQIIWSLSGRLARQMYGEFDNYLKSCRGVIHIGANTGQERMEYQRLGLEVLWVEPIPDIFEILCRNIQDFPKQIAIQALVADKDDQAMTLNIASNGGASSSIFELAKHKDIWPDVHYVRKIEVTSKTLLSLLANDNVDLHRYDALLIDAQGSEFAILKGAHDVLSNFAFIQVEAANFEAYAGAVRREAIEDYLRQCGFNLKRERTIAQDKGIGRYFDLLFENRN